MKNPITSAVPLPHVPLGRLFGLIEAMAETSGPDDLFRLADRLSLELDELLPLVEAAQLLGWARVEHGDYDLTEEGRRIADGSLTERKAALPRTGAHAAADGGRARGPGAPQARLPRDDRRTAARSAGSGRGGEAARHGDQLGSLGGADRLRLRRGLLPARSRASPGLTPQSASSSPSARENRSAMR